jgi:hypothetical protein
MENLSKKAIKIGLGIRGIIGALVLGLICLFQPLFGNTESLFWAKILLILAAFVYVVFSFIWDKDFLLLTNTQFIVASVLLGLTIVTEEIFFIGLGLFVHAMWDLWHLATQQRYVPWWYAGACVYVDLAAVLLLVIKF